MRIISGSCRGRPVKAVAGMKTRPTTDKVREALFHRIGPYFDGGSMLDLYSGSGAVGLEALSRGMDHAVFVDEAQAAVKTIRANVKSLNMAESAEIYRTDAAKAVRASARKNRQFDIIFMDPPYADQQVNTMLELIWGEQILKADGLVIAETSSDAVLQDSGAVYYYGGTKITIWEADEIYG
ncbi:16S rRNA (guanine(966)-N(2))-methyltransferase RsmD [Alkalicoccus chagannorensis]|uniref:16S rRNA (guanine(966)-N(2))-methyltransferase RsmD n=1 Tax=Alkalicoccus chagannorensis TaxID=427072 RepID=UPI00047CC7D2|nr:16S rRNA (guanine(966)-N(2))-methyltransferase RsmD [Alkalicoccus chagannorensis]